MQTDSENTTNHSSRQIARAAGTVMIAMVLSQITGLVTQSLIGSTFGTSLENDAYYAANRFTEIIFNLVAGGALSSAFIPTFTDFIAKHDRKNAWKLASSITNLMLVIMTTVAVLSYFFAPWIVRTLLLPGAVDNPEKIALTIQLLRIQLPTTVIFGVSGLLMGILNTHQNFFVPALTPTLYRLGSIFSILFLVPKMGIQGLAWGAVIGAAGHFLLQLPAFLKLPDRQYLPTFGLKMPAVREVGRLMAPRLLGVAVVQLNFLVNSYLASFQPDGSYTSITLGFTLMMMPEIAIAQSIAIASLPTFSAQVALGKKDEMRGALADTLRSVLILAIPAAVGLIILREPIVSIIFQRGEFTGSSVTMVAWALLWYAVGLVFHSILEIVSRAFYALHDTKTPVLIGIIAMSINLGLSVLFSKIFEWIGWMPHGGLAFANSLATALEITILLILMRRRLKGLEGKRIFSALLQSGAAVMVMAGALWGWFQISTKFSTILITLGGIAIGAAGYGVMLLVLKVPELQSGLIMAKKIFGRFTHKA
jgi:putative peptidoglycan lipid II flippase